MRSPVVWLVALAACGSAADPAADLLGGPDPGTPPLVAPVDEADAADDRDADRKDDGGPAVRPEPDVPYPDAIQKSTHNSYERDEPLLDQLLYHRIRSLELDIHSSKANVPAPSGEWFVYHEDSPFMRDTSCVSLSRCLGQVAAFHRAIPEHEVVTLFIDLKDSFAEGHTPSELDALLASVLGRSTLYTPADALAACPGAKGLADALAGTCTFPTLGALRGKVIVAVTGGSACNATSGVMRYGESAAARIAFAAPNFDATCAVSSQDGNAKAAVFVNTSWEARAQAAEGHSRGLVTRIYGVDKPEFFAEARSIGANHLATDKANADFDGWAATFNAQGFPFECAGCDDVAEPGPVLRIAATSGDLWGTADSGFFAYDDAATGAETWTTLPAVPSSHVEPFAKACIVARASEAADAAYAGLCLPFEDNPPRFQLRSATGAETTSQSAASMAGLALDTPAFLRLVVTPDGASRTAVRADTSPDGVSWTALAQGTLETALPVRGLAVSSHDAGPVRAYFAATTRATGRARKSVTMTSFAKTKAIGASASGSAEDGAAP